MLTVESLFGVFSIMVISIIAWWWNVLWNKITLNELKIAELSKQMIELELRIANSYVHFDHFAEFKRDVISILGRIEEKIDRKEDKHEHNQPRNHKPD